MLVRVGNVLYWLSCAAAIFFAGLAAYIALAPSFSTADRQMVPILFGGIAILAWLAGRGFRYILAGR